jgi:Adenylate and Guanylate cyclase catalytic domain
MTSGYTTGTKREVVHSTLDHYHDDDLSIVGSDEDPSMDGQSLAPGETAQKARKTAPIDLVRRETRAAMICRYILLLLLVLSGALLSVGTYRWVSDVEENSTSGSCGLQVEESFAQNLEQNLIRVLQARFLAAFTVSSSFTSLVLDRKQLAASSQQEIDWPYITIPHYDARLTGLLESYSTHYGALQVIMAPMVVAALKTTFEEYAVTEQLKECATCQPVEQIINPSSASLVDGTNAPVWQIAPFTTQPIKLLNLYGNDVNAGAIENMKTLKSGILADIQLPTTDDGKENAKEDGPKVSLWYPVYRDFQQVEVAASLAAIYLWKHLLEEALPLVEDNDAYVSLHLESCTGTVESFEISGMTVTYIGSIQSSTEDIKAVSTTFSVPGGYAYGSSEALKVDKDICNYNVWLMPTESSNQFLSAEGDDNEDSNKAVVYTALVASLFFLLLVCFLVYDWLMEKRQSVVSNIATKSSAIVENLFPAQVRDRMLQGLKNAHHGDDQEKPIDNGGVSKNSMPAAPGGLPGPVSVKQFLSNDDGMSNNLSSQPIADLFPNTTVLFADIAGFTAWSSQREPTQVFTLLETLYRSFDVIAKKLKVFKGTYLCS